MLVQIVANSRIKSDSALEEYYDDICTQCQPHLLIFKQNTRSEQLAGVTLLKTGVSLPVVGTVWPSLCCCRQADNFSDCLHHVPAAPARLSKGLLSETNSHSPDRGMIILSGVGDDIPTHYHLSYNNTHDHKHRSLHVSKILTILNQEKYFL